MLGTLGVAMVALVLDNLPGPSSASAGSPRSTPNATASPAPSPDARTNSPASPTATARDPEPDRRALAQLMATLRLDAHEALPDVFAVQQAVFTPDEPVASELAVTAAETRPSLRGVRVSAVTAEGDGRSGRALVDGRVVRVGDTISEGWRVSAIRSDGVHLVHEDGAEALLRFSAAGIE